MIVEHCCCHRQLPDLIKAGAERVTPFHTNGDVTLDDVFRAISYNIGPSALTVITPELGIEFLRDIEFYFRRKWITSLRLLCHDNQLEMVNTNLADYIGKTEYLHDKRITESSSLMILEGRYKRLAVSGYFPTASPADSGKPYRMVNHFVLYTENNDEQWRDVIQIPTLPFHIHKLK